MRSWIYHKLHSTLYCVIGFHKGCDGTAYGQVALLDYMCGCVCHVRPT